MITITYISKTTGEKFQSDFKTVEEMNDHKLKFPDMYSKEFYDLNETDNTYKVEQENRVQSRIAKQNLGQRIIAIVTEINKSKNYSVIQFQQLLADPQLIAIERLAWSGSLELLKNSLLSYSGPWFTAVEIGLVVAEIDSFFSNN
jgi:hypothetical protein